MRYICLFCCSGRIPRLSLIQHSLYVGVAEKQPPPYHSQGSSTERWSRNTRGWSLPECFISSGFFNIPLYFLIIQWRQQHHLMWSTTHDVVSWKINLWKSFNLLYNVICLYVLSVCFRYGGFSLNKHRTFVPPNFGHGAPSEFRKLAVHSVAQVRIAHVITSQYGYSMAAGTSLE